ncbi:MAG: histidine phosphatase family protein [Pseudomonadales bacterium]
MTTLILIRHAESQPSADVAEPDWPLSDKGVVQASDLADQLEDFGIEHIYSSPFPRAIATVHPLATRLGFEPVRLPDLRERKLSDRQLPDWQEHVRRSWQDFDYRAPGGETNRECQARIATCLGRLAGQHPGQTIAACSHGNLIAVFLHTIDPAFGHEQWAEMQNPAVFRLAYSSAGWRWLNR